MIVISAFSAVAYGFQVHLYAKIVKMNLVNLFRQMFPTFSQC